MKETFIQSIITNIECYIINVHRYFDEDYYIKFYEKNGYKKSIFPKILNRIYLKEQRRKMKNITFGYIEPVKDEFTKYFHTPRKFI